ncbi:MAG: hypothetical protein SGPRY_007297 [Prymnesium sp.]
MPCANMCWASKEAAMELLKKQTGRQNRNASTADEEEKKTSKAAKKPAWQRPATKARKSELLSSFWRYEISVRDLHNKLIELSAEKGSKGGGLPEMRDAKGKLLISATSLPYAPYPMPPQLKPAAEHRKKEKPSVKVREKGLR